MESSLSTDPDDRLGLLGAGHLADDLLAGFRRAGIDMSAVLVSPRGRSAALAARHGVGVARDNADLVRSCRRVILSVRPAQAAEAVAGPPWRADQTLISVCAGVPLSALAAARPAHVVRAMPITAAAIGQSPTAVFAANDAARATLGLLGDVIELDREADFDVATAPAALYGWAHQSIGLCADWLSAHGLEDAAARRLAAQTYAAAAGMILAEPETPIDAMVERLKTPGGITALLLEVLAERGADAATVAALDAVLARLRAVDTKAP